MNRGEIKSGQVVSVFGCGGVGINVVQFAVLAGAKVIAVDISNEKIEHLNDDFYGEGIHEDDNEP